MIASRGGHHAGWGNRAREEITERAASFERAGMLEKFQFEDQLDRREAEVGAAGFYDGRPSDVRTDKLISRDDAVSGDLGGGHGDQFPLPGIRWIR